MPSRFWPVWRARRDDDGSQNGSAAAADAQPSTFIHLPLPGSHPLFCGAASSRRNAAQSSASGVQQGSSGYLNFSFSSSSSLFCLSRPYFLGLSAARMARRPRVAVVAVVDWLTLHRCSTVYKRYYEYGCATRPGHVEDRPPLRPGLNASVFLSRRWGIAINNPALHWALWSGPSKPVPWVVNTDRQSSVNRCGKLDAHYHENLTLLLLATPGQPMTQWASRSCSSETQVITNSRDMPLH